MTDPVEPDAIRSTLLQPALDHVIAAARRRPSEIPAGLKKVLKFKKLPAPARAQVARSVDNDVEFRVAMSEGVRKESVGEAGLLWLERPAGWEDRLGTLVAQEQRREAALEALRSEDNAVRQDEAAHAELAESRNRLAQMEAELAGLRDRQAETELALRRQREETDRVSEQLDRAREERAEAIRQLKRQEELVARSVGKRHELEAAVVAAGAKLPDVAAQEARAMLATVKEQNALLEQTGLSAHDLASDLMNLAERAAALSLHLAPRAKSSPVTPEPVRSKTREASAVGHETDPAGDAVSPHTSPRSFRRERIGLPGGVWADSPGAVAHLCATSGVTVLVDGYNVTIGRWASLTISDQRDRLVRVAGAVAARSGARIVLVWDGVDDVGTHLAAKLPRDVSVTFTSTNTEADDWIIEYCQTAPVSMPLVVVSDDRRVRDGVDVLGVNLLTGSQLVGYGNG